MARIKEIPHVDTWIPINLELYCMLNLDYFEKESPFWYKLPEGNDWDVNTMEREPNPKYDPKAKPIPWPKECKKKLNIDCLTCKHVAYCEGGDDEE